MMHPNMNDFATFCRSKPADMTYMWSDPKICACGQFAKAIGRANWVSPVREPPQETRFWSAANDLAEFYPRTFGALADRVEKAIAEKRAIDEVPLSELSFLSRLAVEHWLIEEVYGEAQP